MADYLVFTLAAALAATGEFAGHERRGSVGWPGRSAILGLVAAAQGIRRDEAERLAALESLQTAVAVFEEGSHLRDYHTVITIPTAKAKRPNSRRDAFAMAAGEINTAITKRDYRTSPLFGVALWNGNLSEISEALKSPHFTLYLGRKSCPLAAPLAPQIVVAESPGNALLSLRLPPWYNEAKALRMYCDVADGDETGDTEQRNDVAIDRVKWHFRQRMVHRVPVDISIRRERAL